MDVTAAKTEHLLQPKKAALFHSLSKDNGMATVAEIGIGTAPNLCFYGPRVDRILGVDTNPAMWQYAKASAAKAGVQEGRLTLLVGDAEALPLPDSSVDAVVATHVLCEVRDVDKALQEIRRVLRPGGRYYFLEHVAAQPHTALLLWQQRINPLWSRVMGGCQVTKKTLSSIQSAGFSGVEAERFGEKEEMPWFVRIAAPHVAGVATK